MGVDEVDPNTSSEPGLRILSDLRVIEFATEIAGPYAGKLFCDAGADVIKVEPPLGDSFRLRSASGSDLRGLDSALFRHLNFGKRSVIGSPGGEEVERLVESADILIESFLPAEPLFDEWMQRYPKLVVLSITPFGRTGPWRNRPATGFTVQAESGSLGARGQRDGIPFQAGGRIAEWSCGVFGAVGAFVAALEAGRSGFGDHVDCPWITADHTTTNPNMSLTYDLMGRPPITSPARVVDAPSIERTSDGFIGLNTNTRQQFEDFVRMIDRSNLLEDERWFSAEYRMLNLDEWNSFVSPWMRARSSDEIMELASLWRIPVAPVNNGRTLLQQDHFRKREVFALSPDGDFTQPVPPYLLDGERPRARGPAPRLGEASGRIEERLAPLCPALDGSPQVGHPAPFSGLRVLDATAMWAGPLVGQIFAAFGADVIHLESIQRLDLGRLKVDAEYGKDQWWERAPDWFMINPNKRDLTLDLRDERGRALLKQLIATCDVMVENFSPRVFDSFGFSFEEVRHINPGILYVRMPAFGLDGPWRENVGFAQTMEQVSGLAWVTGHREDPTPHVPRGPCDPLAGYHVVFALLVAHWRRLRSGEGASLEAAMTESALNAAAELLIEYTAYGKILQRMGNRSCDAAPQGLYRCAGDDQWLALSVRSDDDWQALKGVVGHPTWAKRPELDTHEGRTQLHDELDRELGSWALDREVHTTVERLIEAGVPAAAMRDPRLADQHPQLAALGYFETIDHPVVGSHLAPSLPFRFKRVDRWFKSAAPTLGQHNEQILCGLLGVAPEEYKLLEQRDVIGNSPLGSNPTFNL